MRKLSCSIMTLLILLIVCSCGKAVDVEAWQEQYDLGIRYLFDGEYEEAVIAFEQAIQIAPKKTEAYLGASDAYKGLDDTDQALALLQEALTIDEQLPEIYIKLSDIYVA